MTRHLLVRPRCSHVNTIRSVFYSLLDTESFQRVVKPAGAELFDRLRSGDLPTGWERALPDFEGETLATRVASGKILNALVGVLPELWGGSCDLSDSTATKVEVDTRFSPDYAGRTVFFGIREHAQAAALSGMSLSELTRPYGSTYFAFSDYQRPALRLASLMGLPSIFLWTHDSLAVGEDGPTHQPVEQLAAVRSIPGFTAIRPADAWETRTAWQRVIADKSGPVGFVLSRQNLPILHAYRDVIAAGAPRGGYVLADFAEIAGTGSHAERVILLATGSEVSVTLAARDLLAQQGVSARVVSMPSFEWFEAQDVSYRESVLPGEVRARVSVEAGTASPWGKYVGLDGASISVESFGKSGDGAEQLRQAGFTPDHVASVAASLVK